MPDQIKLRAHIVALARRSGGPGGGGGKGKVKAGKKKAQGAAGPAAAARAYPKKIELPAGAWTEPQVQAFCFHGTHILRDANNQRWLISYDGVRRSRSWGIHGYARSAMMTIQLAWQSWDDLGRQPHCPIEGLLSMQYDDED